MSDPVKDTPGHPPKWAERLLTWSCPKESIEEVQGDLLELYHHWIETEGEKEARKKYVLNAIKLQKPLAKLASIKLPNISGTGNNHSHTKTDLFILKNYFLVAFRNLRRNKSYVIINALGVGIALTCCLAAYLVLAFNLEFDDFHADKKVERIFKIHTLLREKDGTILLDNNAPMALPPFALPQIAGIERFTRYLRDRGYMHYRDKAFTERISFADSTFFDMFDFPLLTGNHKAFKDKHSILISEKLAKKYFGDEEPIGKTLVLNFPNDMEVQFIVGGVLKKVPRNNTFNFDAIVRIENFLDVHQLAIDNWSDPLDPSTFFELTSAESAPSISKQLNKYIPIRNEARNDELAIGYQLEHFKTPFTIKDIHSGNTSLRAANGILLLFASMAAMILLIACFNLTNTTIAMTAKRLKEIGIRKTIGAFRKQIVTQFLLETIITITLSLGVGLVMAQWIVPAFSSLYNIPFTLADVNSFHLVGTLVALVFFASLLAGIYPALFNSKFKPVVLLKGGVKIKGTNVFTRTLVMLQFALSVIVLIGGVFFTRNAEFQESMSFGYDTKKIITVNVQSEKEFEAMENEIVSNSKILSVSGSENNIGHNSYESTIQIGTREYKTLIAGIGKNYFETMGLKLSEGRFLNVANESDRKDGVIVNRAFVNKTGMKDPIDKVILMRQTKRHIVGVIENHVEDMFISESPQSFVFYIADPADYKIMEIKTETKDLIETRNYLEATWKKMFPTRPFESQFQEDIVLSDARMITGSFKSIFLFLTVLGGLLSVSGIFSLASLNIARRTKEIGVRKTFGASITNVITLLNKEFAMILALAAMVGSIGGYLLLEAMLGAFNIIHIKVGIFPAVLCSLFIFSIGIITTSVTILKAARTNPVDTLRSD